MAKSIEVKTRVKTLFNYDKRDSLDTAIEKIIVEQAADGYSLESCHMTSCENYNTVRYGVILMFKRK